MWSLKDKDDTEYKSQFSVGFVNNGIMALFDNTTYMIDGRHFKTIKQDVDVATTIIGLSR